MKILGHYAQVSDTSHGCNHEQLDVIVDYNWQLIECARCKKRWERISKCCALDCDLLVEHLPLPFNQRQSALPFCADHMKDEALVRAWEELS